jgi:hypothetical protein
MERDSSIPAVAYHSSSNNKCDVRAVRLIHSSRFSVEFYRSKQDSSSSSQGSSVAAMACHSRSNNKCHEHAVHLIHSTSNNTGFLQQQKTQ